MIHTNDIYLDSVRHDETPEQFFRSRLQVQPGVPFLVNPFEELQERYYFIKEKIRQQPIGFDADFIRMFHHDTDILCAIDEVPEKKYWFSIWEKAKKRHGLQGFGCFNLDRLEETVENIYNSHPDRISQNTYFTINTYYRPGFYPVQDTRYPVPARGHDCLSFLNACYVDIDGGRFFDSDFQYKLYASSPELYNEIFPSKPNAEDPKAYSESYHWEQILFHALYMEQEGLIPEVSVFARSGRGVYLIWLFETPVRAFADKIEEYKEINEFLGNEFRYNRFPADKIKDAARVLRLNGTTHTGSNTQVCYYPNRREDVVKTYSFDELRAFCNLNHPKRKIPWEEKVFKEAKEKGTVPARARGVMSTAEYRIDDFLKIQEAQGGINRGIRYHSLGYLIRFMRIAQYDQELILEIANQVAANCNPPYPCEGEENDIPVEDIIKREFAGKNKALKFNNETLAKLWGVEKATAEELNLRSIKPVGAKYKHPKSPHKKKVSNRKDAIIAIYQKYPDCTPGKCLTLLEKQYGIETSKSTVKREIKQLSSDGLITVVQRSAGRPTRKSTPS